MDNLLEHLLETLLAHLFGPAPGWAVTRCGEGQLVMVLVN